MKHHNKARDHLHYDILWPTQFRMHVSYQHDKAYHEYFHFFFFLSHYQTYVFFGTRDRLSKRFSCIISRHRLASYFFGYFFFGHLLLAACKCECIKNVRVSDRSCAAEYNSTCSMIFLLNYRLSTRLSIIFLLEFVLESLLNMVGR